VTQTQGQNYFEILNLDRSDMIEVLEQGIVGHLGCVNHNEVYVVPITYAYAQGCVYSHSHPGKKIEMMRQSPHVCFQVEDIDNVTHWKSVIAWGEFEEVRGPDLGMAKELLLNKLADSMKENDLNALSDAIIYRIKISKITGCAESDSL